MQIRCKQIRPGGSRITMGNKTYHFAPNAEGAHVCEVTDKTHIGRFLSITEGYEVYGSDAAKAATVQAPPSAPAATAETTHKQPKDNGKDSGNKETGAENAGNASEKGNNEPDSEANGANANGGSDANAIGKTYTVAELEAMDAEGLIAVGKALGLSLKRTMKPSTMIAAITGAQEQAQA